MYESEVNLKIESSSAITEIVLTQFKKYISSTNKDYYANYTKTEKNKPSGKVFCKIGFEENSVKDGITSLRFKSDKEILNDNLIDIFDESLN